MINKKLFSFLFTTMMISSTNIFAEGKRYGDNGLGEHIAARAIGGTFEVAVHASKVLIDNAINKDVKDLEKTAAQRQIRLTNAQIDSQESSTDLARFNMHVGMCGPFQEHLNKFTINPYDTVQERNEKSAYRNSTCYKNWVKWEKIISDLIDKKSEESDQDNN